MEDKKIFLKKHPTQKAWSVRSFFANGKQYVSAGDVLRCAGRISCSGHIDRVPSKNRYHATKANGIKDGRGMWYVDRVGLSKLMNFRRRAPDMYTPELKNWILDDVFEKPAIPAQPSLFGGIEAPSRSESELIDELSLLREQNKTLHQILNQMLALKQLPDAE